jgi:putative membrane protein
MIAMIQGGCPWCGFHMGWWGPWGMTLGWLIVVLVIAGMVWLFRRMPGTGDGAERALRERYAHGELDEESYRRMLGELRRR